MQDSVDERFIPDANLPTESVEGVLDIANEGSGLLRPSFAASDADTTIVYYTMYGEDGGVYRAKHSGGVWNITDISPNLRVNGKLLAPISDITVDPYNANRVWVAFGGVIASNKVFYTNNAFIFFIVAQSMHFYKIYLVHSCSL